MSTVMADYSRSTLSRFWAKVDVRGPDECWPWTGSKKISGYGRLKLERSRKNRSAHIIAYEIENGQVPLGMMVCHSCDNPPCCNPRHIFIGTHQDNMDDAVQKGRMRGNNRSNIGADNPNAKLSTEQVEMIRIMFEAGMNNCQIGREFNVTHQTIWRIRKGLIWNSVGVGKSG